MIEQDNNEALDDDDEEADELDAEAELNILLNEHYYNCTQALNDLRHANQSLFGRIEDEPETGNDSYQQNYQAAQDKFAYHARLFFNTAYKIQKEIGCYNVEVVIQEISKKEDKK
jgi:hypothetical protein